MNLKTIFQFAINSGQYMAGIWYKA